MEKLNPLSRIPIIEGISKLRDIKGDVVSAILFLPVALMVQEIMETLFSNGILSFSGLSLNALKLSFIVYISTIEVLAIIMVLMNLGLAAIYEKPLVALSVLFFSTAMILMGYTKDHVQFKFVFIFSLIIAFGGVRLFFSWEEYFATFKEDKARRIMPFFVILLVIGSIIFTSASPPLK